MPDTASTEFVAGDYVEPDLARSQDWATVGGSRLGSGPFLVTKVVDQRSLPCQCGYEAAFGRWPHDPDCPTQFPNRQWPYNKLGHPQLVTVTCPQGEFTFNGIFFVKIAPSQMST